MNVNELKQAAEQAAREANAAAEREDWADWEVLQQIAENLANKLQTGDWQ